MSRLSAVGSQVLRIFPRSSCLEVAVCRSHVKSLVRSCTAGFATNPATMGEKRRPKLEDVEEKIYNSSPMAPPEDTSELSNKPLAAAERLAGSGDVLIHEGAPPIEAVSVAKGLFCNKFDVDNLVYPEFVETEDLLNLEDYCKKVQRFMSLKVDSAAIDAEAKVPDEVITWLKEQGLFGLQIPKEYGGLGFNNKEVARVYEALASDFSVLTKVFVHNELCARSIVMFGDEAQKQKYLPRLANGESIGAFAVHEESSGEDTADIQTRASLSQADSETYYMTGAKHWVTNGSDADIIVTLAKVTQLQSEEMSEFIPSTAFIVDKQEGKVEVTKDKKPIGVRGASFQSKNEALSPLTQVNGGLKSTGISTGPYMSVKKMRILAVSDIAFRQTRVSAANLIGCQNDGFNLVKDVVDAGQFVWGAIAASFVRRILEDISAHCNKVSRFGMRKSENNALKKRVTKLTLDAYAAESMTYYVAGLLDEDPTHDVILEGSMICLHARTIMREAVQGLIQILGASAMEQGGACERHLRDLTLLSNFIRSDDYLHGYVGMSAAMTWASEYRTDLAKLSDPKFNIGKKLVRHASEIAEMLEFKPRLRHFLNEHCHPSLEVSCRFVEETMSKFDTVFTHLLTFYGKNIEDEHLVLERLSQIGQMIFSMITVISRSSRSYCIGLRNSDMEITWANTYCMDTRYKAVAILNELMDETQYIYIDMGKKRIAEGIFNEKGWWIDSPVAKNW